MARIGKAWHGMAGLGLAALGVAWQVASRPGMAGHGLARLGGAGHGVARLGKARCLNHKEIAMRTVVTTLASISPYSQSRKIQSDRGQKETAKDHEERTWRERLHATEDGKVFIPPMAFKNCISECAKFMSVQIPGKGKATYTKHFEAGILVADPLVLNITAASVAGEWLFVPSDGKRGGGKRVEKCFPVIPAWSGDVRWYVLDDTITPEVFEQHLREAGNFIGIGRFRPRNNGFYGRFEVKGIKWA